MRKLHIRQKLEELDVTIEDINFGDFDCIGEYAAKKQRDPSDPNYKRYGAFFRPNYERGILIYYLIRQKKLTSFLEIGFGRGYAALCAAKAFDDAGIDGKVTTVDPNFDLRHIDLLKRAYPASWFSKIQFVTGRSIERVSDLDGTFDLIYVDGDHSESGVAADWDLVKDRFNDSVLFDDYHLPSKDDPGIRCRGAIDAIDEHAAGCSEKELIIMDRRLFFDDRVKRDDEIDYGQVLLTKAA